MSETDLFCTKKNDPIREQLGPPTCEQFLFSRKNFLKIEDEDDIIILHIRHLEIRE